MSVCFFLLRYTFFLFFFFALKHRLWVLVRTASLTEAVLTCTNNICFEQKYEKSKKNQLKIVIFSAVKKTLYIYCMGVFS